MGQVLLLEADKLLAENITKALRRRRHKVQWQVEPQAATDSSDQIKPDIIVLDLMLAGRSGVEFLYELRSYPDWQKLPVIIYSDLSTQELQGSFGALEQLNITAYINKSNSSLADLVQKVDHSLQPLAKI